MTGVPGLSGPPSIGAVHPIPEARFEALVAEALDAIPPELGRFMDNVAVLVADRGDPPDLLGLYDGVPLTEREEYGAGIFGVPGGLAMPDRIHLYRLALCDFCDDERQLRDEILVTVVHEVAHHFGIDDERLTELGWD